MPARQQPSIRNRLLAAFSAEDFALLEPHLDTVALPRDRILYECRDYALQARIAAEEIAKNAFHNVSFYAGSFADLKLASN
jgi:hypothetical protein